MTNEQEIRAKALELAIDIMDRHLDILEAKPQQWDTQPIDVLFRLADSIVPYITKSL